MTTMLQERHKHFRILSILGIMVLAGVLRLFHMGHDSIWYDEACSIWFSAQTFHYLWNVLPQFETHPPFYYSILKIWRMAFGSSEVALRGLSGFINVMTVPLVYLSARFCTKNSAHSFLAGLTAALVFACTDLQVAYSHDARPYAFLVFAMAVAVTAACWIVANPQKSSLPPTRLRREAPQALAAYVALAVGIALLQWLHNTGGIFILVIAGALGAWWICVMKADRNVFKNLMLAGVLAFALYAPYLADFLRQSAAMNSGFWLKAPTAKDLVYSLRLLYNTSIEGLDGPVSKAVCAINIAVLSLAGFYGLYKANKPHANRFFMPLLILCLAFGPLAANLIITYTMQPIFLLRTVLPVQFAWCVLVGAGMASSGRRTQMVLAVIMAGCTLSNLHTYYTSDRLHYNEKWRELTTIAATEAKDAPVLVIPNVPAIAMQYYSDMNGYGLEIKPLPSDYPEYDAVTGWKDAGMTDEVAEKTLQSLKGRNKVWLTTRGDEGDPENKLATALEKEFTSEVKFDFNLLKLRLYTRR
jgi:mannosyltransferase